MAWLKVITLLEFSQLRGMIDPLPSAAPRLCNQKVFVCRERGAKDKENVFQGTKGNLTFRRKERIVSQGLLTEIDWVVPLCLSHIFRSGHHWSSV